MELDILKGKKVAELREIAAALKIEGAAKLKKSELIAIFTRMHEDAVASGAAEEEAPAAFPQDERTRYQNLFRTILMLGLLILLILIGLFPSIMEIFLRGIRTQYLTIFG